MKFSNHIANKICNAGKQIDMITRAFYWAPENARLIEHLVYASSVGILSQTRRQVLKMVPAKVDDVVD